MQSTFLSSAMGTTPIPDDQNTYINLYEANSRRQFKISSVLSSENEPLDSKKKMFLSHGCLWL